MSNISEVINALELTAVTADHDPGNKLPKGTLVKIKNYSSDDKSMIVQVLRHNPSESLKYSNSNNSGIEKVGANLRLPLGYNFSSITRGDAPVVVQEYNLVNYNTKSDVFLDTSLHLHLDDQTIELSIPLTNYLNLKSNSRILILREAETNADYLAVADDPNKGYALSSYRFVDRDIHKLLSSKYTTNPFLSGTPIHKVYVEVYMPFSSPQYPNLTLYKLKVHAHNIRLMTNSNTKVNAIRKEVLQKIEQLMYNT